MQLKVERVDLNTLVRERVLLKRPETPDFTQSVDWRSQLRHRLKYIPTPKISF